MKYPENKTGKQLAKLDRRDEMILVIIAIVTPLAVLPAMLGF